MNDARKIFVSVAEASADMHAAALIRAAASLLPGAQFSGVTGPKMRNLGAETVGDLTSHAAMLMETASVVGRAMQVKRAVEDSWRTRRPDVVVLLDSPEFHLPLAAKAREMGLRVLYYIAPQTWASRVYRNRRIARDVERLACILPFEEPFFRAAGVNATYVGHPLFESLALEGPDKTAVARLRRGGKPVVAILPGSRRHVIDEVLPLQLRVLAAIRRSIAVDAAISCAAPERRAQIAGYLEAVHEAADIVVADNASLLTAADLVLVASGTATLHVAHYRKPMIVMYHARGMAWASSLYDVFGRFVVTTPHQSLVNILAGARVVPEFMPFIREPDAIAAVATRLLTDETWRRVMARQIDAVVAPLERTTASANVCRMLREMTERSTAAAPRRARAAGESVGTGR